jgi:hypothetical protein
MLAMMSIRTCVADDSSLRQANKLKLKGYKRAHQDLQPSLTQRQVTRLHFKTIWRASNRYTFIQGKREECHAREVWMRVKRTS